MFEENIKRNELHCLFFEFFSVFQQRKLNDDMKKKNFSDFIFLHQSISQKSNSIQKILRFYCSFLQENASAWFLSYFNSEVKIKCSLTCASKKLKKTIKAQFINSNNGQIKMFSYILSLLIVILWNWKKSKGYSQTTKKFECKARTWKNLVKYCKKNSSQYYSNFIFYSLLMFAIILMVFLY